MSFVPFVYLFPGQGEDETRTFIILHHPSLPSDEYALAESYCADPDCDCRRVLMYVFGRG